MDISKRGKLNRMLYLYLYFLLWFCLFTWEPQQVAAAEEPYMTLLENEGQVGDAKSKLDLNNLLPSPSGEDENYKRSSAFFPLRGKKLILNSHGPVYQTFASEQEDTNKRSQFFPLRGKKIPDDLKRASYFMPMRGRKDDINWNPEEYGDMEENPDKKASSFMPMRGKKEGRDAANMYHLGKTGMYINDVTGNLYSTDSNSNQMTGKRASYFLPMRGKRSSENPTATNSTGFSTFERNENETDLDEIANHTTKKRSVSFMPMRERKETADPENISDDFNAYNKGGIITNLVDKKKYAFMPMRGRRDYSNKTNMDQPPLEADKKSVSFMPMRGRREENEKSTNGYYDKRAQYFMPMRGRRLPPRDVVFGRDLIPSFNSPDKKASYFTAMRGRRSVDISHHSEDSASKDSMKRTAFMAMRGRRSLRPDIEDNPDWKVQEWSPEELMSLFNKRSAFMPMRGRRTLRPDIEDDPNWKVQDWPAEDLVSLFDKKSSSFMPMRGRRIFSDNGTDDFEYENIDDKRASSFMPMRGRRRSEDMEDSSSFYNPYTYFMAGIGSSLISRPYNSKTTPFSYIRDAVDKKRKFQINWDSVKRAFHATRGKRMDDVVNSLKDNYPQDTQSDIKDNQSGYPRIRRSILRPRVSMQPQRQYIALKRPMSFFATRGKRLDDSTLDKISKLR